MPELTMIIENEQDIRGPARNDLERAGRRASASADGEQGLRCFIAPRPDSTMEIGSLRVDPLARTATYRGQPLVLHRMELDLLVYLARHRGRVIPSEELRFNAWGPDRVGHRHAVAVHMGWLRANLGDAGRLIQTVAGVGYRLVIPRDARP